jgi:hypothetical protein
MKWLSYSEVRGNATHMSSCRGAVRMAQAFHPRVLGSISGEDTIFLCFSQSPGVCDCSKLLTTTLYEKAREWLLIIFLKNATHMTEKSGMSLDRLSSSSGLIQADDDDLK